MDSFAIAEGELGHKVDLVEFADPIEGNPLRGGKYLYDDFHQYFIMLSERWD